MPFQNLQSYLTHLEANGLLERVRAQVDAEYEINEIAQRVVRQEGPALLFERVKGADFPLAINFFGSFKHIELLLGMHPEQLGEKLANLIDTVMPPSPKSLWNARSYAPMVLASRPKQVGRAACHEVIEKPDLSRLPVLKLWPGDGGRFLTFPLVMTRDPVNRDTNLAIYRMHVYNHKQTGMHMQIQKGGGFHHHKAEKMDQPLELACVLGADPVLMLTGIFPLPEGLEEIVFSGVLRGARTKLTRATTLDMLVPAEAEFVLEGSVPAHERKMEGPFGDHFGHYSEAAPFPVFNVHRMTRRRKPVYPAAVVGKPPQEDKYMGEASQMILKPFVKLVRPEVRDLWAYYEAGFHNLLVAAVEGRYLKEPIKVALGLFGEGQLSLSKVLVLVEPTVGVRNIYDVLGAIRRNFVAHDDFHLISRAPLDTLDFTSFKMHLGSKMIIDATGHSPEPVERGLKINPVEVVAGIKRWRLLADALLVVQVDGDPKPVLERLVHHDGIANIKMVAAVSSDVNLDDDVSLLWGIFTRFDAARDVTFTRMALHGIKPTYAGVMAIDATFKEGYPAPTDMDPEIVKRVDDRWHEYFPREK